MGEERQLRCLDSGQPEGRYANYFEVGHNAYEFVIDCGQLHEGAGECAYWHTRIITSPAYAKRLLATLATSVGQYEQAFGVIEEHGSGAL